MPSGSGAIQGVGTAVVTAVALSFGLSNQAVMPMSVFSPPQNHTIHVIAPKGRNITVNKG